MKHRFLRMLLASSLIIIFTFTPSSHSASAAGPYWQYIPNSCCYYWINQGEAHCFSVPQDSFQLHFYLNPTQSDIDMGVRTGSQWRYSTRPSTQQEEIRLDINQSYRDGIAVCAIGYQAGYYRISVWHSGF